jgi:hypothetical protein
VIRRTCQSSNCSIHEYAKLRPTSIDSGKDSSNCGNGWISLSRFDQADVRHAQAGTPAQFLLSEFARNAQLTDN